MPTVSVIVPTYNRATWLPETVNSILEQSHPPLEVLVIDDGSSDNTAEVCAAFPSSVRYVRQENAGVSAARNRGMREAKGEWIAFADSDDPWEPTKLEIQLKAMEAIPHAEWSITGCSVIDLEGRKVPGTQSWGRVFAVFDGGKVDPDQHFVSCLEKKEIKMRTEAHLVYAGDAFGLLFLGNVVLPSSVLMRRGLFERIGGFDESFRVAEETEYFHRLAATAPLAIVMTPLTRYRVGHAVSLISSANMVRLIENAIMSSERAIKLRSHLSDAEKKAITSGRSKLLFRLAYTRLTILDKVGARTAIRKAWEQEATLDGASFGIYLATYLPGALLRLFRNIRRGTS